MIENIIATANSSQEEIQTDVLAWKKTSGRFRKWTKNLIIISTYVEYNPRTLENVGMKYHHKYFNLCSL